MYNLLYTALPILLLGIYDFDITTESVYKFPQIYKSCIRNENFTVNTPKNLIALH